MFDGLEQLPVGQRRLLRLADRLDALRADAFNIRYWVHGESGPRDHLDLEEDDQPHCGTVCCAVGYAAMLPEFKAEGLGLEWSADDRRFEPTFAGRMGWGAVIAFFGIPGDVAAELFTWHRYAESISVTADVVAARIRAHVAANTKELTHV